MLNGPYDYSHNLPVGGSVESQMNLTEGDYGDTVTALLEDGRISPMGALEKNGMTQSGIF